MTSKFEEIKRENYHNTFSHITTFKICRINPLIILVLLLIILLLIFLVLLNILPPNVIS